MDRRPRLSAPTWRTVWRTHATDLVVSEVYAEFSGRLRAASTRVILALYAGLWRLVAGWLSRSVCRHMMPLTESADSDLAPVTRLRGAVERVSSFGRSPPYCRSSSIDPPCHLNPPIKMGRADVRLMSSVRTDCSMPPNTALTPEDVSNVPRTDSSQQVAA